jgi:hypothetical protein
MNVGRTLAQAAGEYLGSTVIVLPEELCVPSCGTWLASVPREGNTSNIAVIA